jgi:hypothetical protein
LLLDESGSREMASGAPLNRDDYNLLQSRSPRVLDRSLQGAVEKTFGPHDPLPDLSLPRAEALYLVRRLPRARARRLGQSLSDPVDLAVAEALVALEAGKRERARQALAEVLLDAPSHPEARAALLSASAIRIVDGVDPETLVAAPLDRVERAVVEGWRANDSGDYVALRALEEALASPPPEHPLAADANRLRAEWRVASGEEALTLEAIDIASRAIVDLGNPGDLLLRARACVAAGEPAAALDTLALLAPRTGSATPLSKALAREAARIARAIPPSADIEAQRKQVLRIFDSRTR